MSRLITILILCSGLACIGGRSFAQTGMGRDTAGKKELTKVVYDTTDGGRDVLYFAERGSCKSLVWEPLLTLDRPKVEVAQVPEIVHGAPAPAPMPIPFLQFHGNITYTFDYRDRLDTPFAASNLQQHNEQVYADATLKGRYPFRIVLDSRQSNSPYFKNFTDLNIEFNHQAFQRNVKEAMIAEMAAKTKARDSLNKYESLLKNQKKDYLLAKNWVTNPSRVQEIVQEKEGIYRQVQLLDQEEARLKGTADHGSSSDSGGGGSGPSKDSLLSNITKRRDSLLARMQNPTETEKKMKEKGRLADSLYTIFQSRQRVSDSLRNVENTGIKEYAAKVRRAGSVGELEDLEKQAGTSSMSKSDKALLAVTHFNIGRSAVNYSDLTVNNISLTGVNIEYNPSWYAAFAAGSVDYLFRDFVVQPAGLPKQNLVLGRFGWGDKERRIIILTAYGGTKNSFGGAPVNPVVGSMRVFGYSLETKYKLDRNTVLSVEGAKSSSPYVPGSGQGKSMGDAFAFSDHNNEAFSAKLDLTVPSTRSSFNLFYRNIGANFQSYSVFNSGVHQEGWGIRWRQTFFRDQLTVTTQIKKSIFDDPLVIVGYGTSLLFKSAQLVYRRKKWPVLTAGYMPSTQLIRSPNGVLSENVYYALTAGAFYNYRVGKLNMSSNLMFNRFYNRGTDSGFVLYNARSILYSHRIDLTRVHFTTDIQYSEQPGLIYWSFQQGLDLSIGKYLTAGGSLKNDLVPATGTSYWGGSLRAAYTFRKTGSLRLQYDKDYLPNGSNGIVPDNWGRVFWTKIF